MSIDRKSVNPSVNRLAYSASVFVNDVNDGQLSLRPVAARMLRTVYEQRAN